MLQSMGSGGDCLLSAEDFPLPAELEPEGERDAEGLKTLVVGAGCFWCVEAVFQALEGVREVVSGYAGGSKESADYEQVCSGTTGHAEVVKIRYDAQVISRGRLLQVFFSVAHNPTQLNRQGGDRGTQYRSVIFYSNSAEKAQAEGYMHLLESLPAWSAPLATRLEPLEAFYPAEGYHQNFVRQNPGQPYVQAVATPKLEHLQRAFVDLLSR
ncbi:peptide-methionine (S)-S-oxide reductase MsrA [Marinospirillum sp.]|uniref:peptide-methionine (S)-S-oxide reductase MsrA n=1 Tax=Marinospirillum sp. TaxID=2183934 RepID=UPI00286FC2B6|nr:peptide-methionine (S)-S-oxide reductase MsrA [Marinospirillum sp.]MDR9467851.1 peptide-methionine (S)-S-oxide reductase MsrA [Marinospirillum sp.]